MAGISPETFWQILDRHTAALVLYARQWCSTPEDVVQDVFLLLMNEPTAPENPLGWLYPRAKQYLVDRGRSPAEVEAMPVAQAIMLYSVGLHEDLIDDQFKWMFLPYAASEAGLDRSGKELYRSRRQEILPFSMLISAGRPAKEAETRSQWMLVPLQTCEVLRIYAAAHNGQLPDRLSDIREVPVPVNPYDDKPLQYHRDGDRAVLRAEHGPVNKQAWPWRYEITMLPKAK